MPRSEDLYNAILDGDMNGAVEATEKALEQAQDPQELIDQSMIPAMDEVGKLFEDEEYFVPELLLSGRAMKASMELLRPLLAEQGAESVGRVVIGTVKGDLHDIGKNLVASMLEGAGFEVFDLGVDVSPQAFVDGVKEHKAHLVGLSALLTVTMPSMKDTVSLLEKAGCRSQVKVMIGGAPVTDQYSKDIAADGYADNANSAVSLARNLIGV
jgi:corrinoid protein of di/trimethylamine methyltransferase